jgi:vacuolar-type H+-ATPase subunit E/Vma4
MRSGTSVDDEAKHITEKGLEKIAEKQNKAQGEETDIKADAVASFQQQPNRTIRFLQDQDKRGRRGLLRPGQHQHPVGAL